MNKMSSTEKKSLLFATAAAAATVPFLHTTSASADVTTGWQANGVEEVQQAVTNAGSTYVVHTGDTVSVIAEATGLSEEQIAQANGLANVDLIIAGSGINLPGAATSYQAEPVSYTPAASSYDADAASNAAESAYIASSVAASEASVAASIAASEAAASSVAASNAAAEAAVNSLASAEAASSVAASIAASQAAASAQAVADANAQQTNQVAQAATGNPTAGSSDAAASANVGSGNTYLAGQCTWYVKNTLPWVGNNWGNAAQWASSAQAAGFSTGYTPQAGAVAVFQPGMDGADPNYGHVAVVDSVNSDGTINISEANYAGSSYHTRTISPSGITFIYR